MIGISRSREISMWISALVALVVNTAVSIYNINELIANDEKVDHSRKVLGQLANLLSDIKDTETGQRGYLITGDDSYLKPYGDSLDRIDTRVETLRLFTMDNEKQRASLQELAPLVEQKKFAVKSTIFLQNQFGLGFARQIQLTGYGKEKMDSIREVISRMEQEEEQILTERARISRSKYRATIITALVGGFLTLGMTGLAFILIRRELARRQSAEEGLIATQNALNARARDLSEAQRQTSDTLALLDTFLVNAPIGLAFLDTDLRFVRFNRYLGEETGLFVMETLGRCLNELPAPFPAASREDLQLVLETRDAIVDRLVVDNKSDPRRERVWQSSYYPILSLAGTLLGVGLVTRDITTRLNNERALRESQARFRSLAESMPQFVWVTSPDGLAEYFNQRWFDYTGLNFDECIGHEWVRALHEEDRERTQKYWADSLSSGEPYEVEYRLRGKDGNYRWFLARALPQWDATGKTVNWFGTCTDIHDGKELEDRLRRSVARFRLLAESIRQMVWTSDPQGRVEYYNQRWIDHTGVTVDQAQSWSEVVHPEERDRAVAAWLESLERGIPYEAELRIHGHADGQYRWYLVIAVPMRDESGHVVQWVASLTDIDERKRQEVALERLVRERTQALLETNKTLADEVEVRKKSEAKEREAAEELRRSNQELEQFAYVASHDLQEPLRKIQAFGDRLVQRYREDLGDQGKDYLDRITSSATRMRKLIDDLLTFSRVATGAQPFVSIDLGTIIQDVLIDLEIRIRQSGAVIDVGPLPEIEGDPMQIQQLFLNLLSNALKFQKPGVPPIISIQAAPITMPGENADQLPRKMYRIRVADNGIGFDDRYRDRIFQIFQRLHGRNDYEGTGIGLAICRKIVERHSGQISASGLVGEGATFEIILPVRQSPGVPARV
ncbi:MAG: PAS domain S-box protein [Planctomycetes bacterium]|nr:PAS domain S-box protein [Planctomycetota bacterium]